MAMRSRFEPDRQLTARMAVTMFLLGLVYVAFIAALIVLLKSVVLVVVIAAGLLLAQFWYSDRIALYAMHGRLVTQEEEPRLHGVIDRLCTAADMPKPRVAISDMDLPNAFATGRNADHAVVCVTTGLRRRLTTEELEGVLAHELSHVAHRDVAVITIASFLGVIAGLVVRFAFYSQLFGGRNRDQNTAVALALAARGEHRLAGQRLRTTTPVLPGLLPRRRAAPPGTGLPLQAPAPSTPSLRCPARNATTRWNSRSRQ